METILKISGLSKIYILGKRKNAEKAQKALNKLQRHYETAVARGGGAAAKELEKSLQKARDLFAAEEYEASYAAVTGKQLKKRSKDRGAVVHALNNVSLEIKQGDLIAIIGPSGSGKSTLLNMLGLLDQPTSGQLFINGQNITTIKNRQLPAIRSKELGFVFQSFNLVPTLTALENVMLPLRYGGLGRKERKRIAKAALEQVGLGNRLHHSPDELSGGQQQRVAIARSVVGQPSIVFGDELTGELDSKMTEEVMKLILALNRKGQTFIIVTHNPDVAKLCRRVIYMKDGQIEKETRQR